MTTEHTVWIVFLCCVLFPSAWEPGSMCLNIIVLKVAFLIWKSLVCNRHLNCICRMVIMPEWILWQQNWLKDCLMMWPQAMKPFYVELGYQVIIMILIKIIIIKIKIIIIVIRVAIRHRRLENSLFTMQNSSTCVQQFMTIFYSDVEPLLKYSSVTLYLSPAMRILNENPE